MSVHGASRVSGLVATRTLSRRTPVPCCSTVCRSGIKDDASTEIATTVAYNPALEGAISVGRINCDNGLLPSYSLFTNRHVPVALPSVGVLSDTVEAAEIRKLPLTAWDGKTQVIRSLKDAHTAVELLLEEKVLGFDVEMKPVFKAGQSKSPPALIQVAGAKVVYLFQVHYISKQGQPEQKQKGGIGIAAALEPLRPLISTAKIIKTGVGVLEDASLIQEFACNMQLRGFCEARIIAERLGFRKCGLRNLCAILFGIQVSKAAQMSNWQNSTLTDQQVCYAATDAWTSRLVFLRLTGIMQMVDHALSVRDLEAAELVTILTTGEALTNEAYEDGVALTTHERAAISTGLASRAQVVQNKAKRRCVICGGKKKPCKGKCQSLDSDDNLMLCTARKAIRQQLEDETQGQ